jgi:hypothetical protein
LREGLGVAFAFRGSYTALREGLQFLLLYP